ncbi:MAG: phosphotransferase, partial [Ilumatobacteraceae bacterium]
ESVPGRRYCSVMTWVHGRIVRDGFDHAIAGRLGAVQAVLHEQSSTYTPPEIPRGIIANQVVYFGNTSLLAGYRSAYGSLFVDAIERVQLVLDALWRSPPHRPHLLHGDCGPQNVMQRRGRLTPIDFQDLQFGFDVQDAAITINDLRRQYDDGTLIDAYLAGYRSVRQWPLDDPALELALGAGRRLNFINLGLNLQRPGLHEYIERHAASLAQWMGLATKSVVI